MLCLLNGPLNRTARASRVGSGVFHGTLVARGRAVNSEAAGSTPARGANAKRTVVSNDGSLV
jgi:hypothetical protein